MASIAFLCQPGDEVVPPMQRGASVAIIAYQLARRVAASHRVVLFAKRGRDQAARERDASGLEIRTARLPTKNLHRLLDVLSGFLRLRTPYFASPLYYLWYVARFALAVRRERFDVVHIFTYSQYAGLVKALAPDARVVLHMQGEALSQLDRGLVARHLRHVDLVLGCSDDIRDKIRQRFPEYADRCGTVHNGVDVEHFALGEKGRDPSRAERRILFVGRVSPEKGVHVLVEAASRVLERFPDARLEIVGSTGMLPYSLHVAWSDDPEVRALARFYGTDLLSRLRQQLMGLSSSYVAELKRMLPASLVERVHFRGPVDHAELLEVYRSADVFAFPSVWPEPFGMPTAEAMACGRPVVATAGGGIPEIVRDGETGILVPRGDANALADALIRLLEDADLAESMGAAGRERAVAVFSWDRVAQELLRAYERLLEPSADRTS